MKFPEKSRAKDFPVFLQKIPENLGEILMGLKPAEAIAYLNAKGFAVTWSWKEQLALNNSQVFTVAKAMRMDILQDIRGMIDKALDTGMDFREFKKELKPMLQKKGWWGYKYIDGKKAQLGSARRLKTIYQTNMQSSYMAGRYKSQKENAVNRPWWLYVNPTPEAEVCKKLKGQIRRYNDPFWNTRYPPNHYNCKSRVRAFTDEQAKSRGIPQKVSVQPDEAFRGNPGIDRWKPTIKDYDNDIWKKGQPVTKGE